MFILEKEKCNIDTSDGHEKNCQVSLKAEKCCINCVNTAYEYSLIRLKHCPISACNFT